MTLGLVATDAAAVRHGAARLVGITFPYDRGEDIVPESHDIDDSPWLALLENASDGVMLFHAEPWRLMYANRAATDWLGRTPEELRGRAIIEVFGGDAKDGLIVQLEDVWNETVPSARCSLERAAQSGRPVTVYLRRVPMGERAAVAMLLRGVASSIDQLEVGTQRARRDPLTGLPDRSALVERMTELLRGDRTADRQFAVLFIDLDNFKQVNDAYGHLVGDRVLGEVGQRLGGCVRSGDMIVRFGGDEFVALVEGVAGWQDIEPVVERIRGALGRPIAVGEADAERAGQAPPLNHEGQAPPLNGGEVMLSVSVGVAEASAEHRTPEDLLQQADRAMYASKRAGA